jgi:integrase/recombinase XerC
MPGDIVPRLGELTIRPKIALQVSENFVEAWLRKQQNANTRKQYKSCLSDFARFAVNAPATTRDIDRALAAQKLLSCNGPGEAYQVGLTYKIHLEERGLVAGTVAFRLRALKSLVTTARKMGYVSWPLDIDVPESEPYLDTAGPTMSAWRQLRDKARELAAAPADSNGRARAAQRAKRDLALIMLMRVMGWRRGELVELNLEHVRREEHRVGIIGKGKRGRKYYRIPKRTWAVLLGWIKVRGSEPGPLFIRLDPGVPDDSLTRLTGDAVCEMVKNMSDLAGLKRETKPHGLRHHSVTRALQAGKSKRAVQKHSRHAKSETIDLYDDALHDEDDSVAEFLDEDE